VRSFGDATFTRTEFRAIFEGEEREPERRGRRRDWRQAGREAAAFGTPGIAHVEISDIESGVIE
jgi:hypothetical protein